jgi:integrase/recombinase XerD
MHLLQAGIAPIIIRDILGHADVRTTEIYARVELETKRRALEAIAPKTEPTRRTAVAVKAGAARVAPVPLI